MQAPQNYKRDSTLYRAALKVLQKPCTVNNTWWLKNCIEECRENRKELYPLMLKTIYPPKKWTIKDLEKCDKTYLACS